MSETTEKAGNTEMKDKAPNGPQMAQGEEIAQLQKQRDEYLDQLQRSRAEFANYKKRSKAQADADRQARSTLRSRVRAERGWRVELGNALRQHHRLRS